MSYDFFYPLTHFIDLKISCFRKFNVSLKSVLFPIKNFDQIILNVFLGDLN